MTLVEKIREELKKVLDPELNINVVDLGLIYGINMKNETDAEITMTLTTPGCPLHDSITSGVKHQIEAMPEIRNAFVELVWEPAWTPEKMSPEAYKQLRGCRVENRN
ncbi:metal-sulfur cluster assembly factor [Neobacillus notoginsengisoli]|uniref:Metal-sulfur cluster assembly factor n=1 Tax=Neobacillus notoginsengisoli TaxID=1578198 RepID=A0A417YY75_9BACI|nr:metal-sulfur cluster assembly factor [Neobacillus notoginsengisoli]RHW42305.1 metal-sulfur cluster assembly factor [Neobacillus notoginsengisoli]